MTRPHQVRRAAGRSATAAACTCLLLAALIAAPDTVHGRGRSDPAAGADDWFIDRDASGHAAFSGMVTDTGSAPLPEVAVAMCASACWPATTDESGRFSYPSLPVERYVLDVRGESVRGRTLTSVVLPVELTDGGRELAPVQLHDATAVHWHGDAPVRFGGLSLIPAGPVDLDALRRAAGADTDGTAAPATIGGARVPPAAWPDYELAAQDAHYQPVAMWALYPFGVRLGGPLELRAARPADPAAHDAELAFFSVDAVTGTAQWLGPAVADQDYLRTGPDRGISSLTWVILAARTR